MAENEVLLKVEGLSKKFCKDLKTSLWYGVKDLFSNLRGNKEIRELRDKEFWAVKDINFELRRGECLGLIGHNGAGKSTLLKILNGLMMPDAGTVTIRGKVGALIELGAGFNPILTGRENIYNNGAILGFTRIEIEEKLEEIIDFAELREFIDMPVKNYSSGMTVRLGFAIAAQMQPDVLIIDEVLAVGDLGFVLKCFNTIDSILPSTAIIFVSHSMPQISRLCDKIILLENGRSAYGGADVAKAIDLYYSRFSSNNSKIIFTNGSINLVEAKLLDTHSQNNGIPVIKWNNQIKLYLKFEAFGLKNIPLFNIQIFDKEQRPVAVFEKNRNNSDLEIIQNCIEISLSHENLQLSKGIYSVNLAALQPGNLGFIYRINDVLKFQVVHKENVWEPFLLKSNYENFSFRK